MSPENKNGTFAATAVRDIEEVDGHIFGGIIKKEIIGVSCPDHKDHAYYVVIDENEDHTLVKFCCAMSVHRGGKGHKDSFPGGRVSHNRK